jgi:predicted DNA-binding transcriptional regulator AlpA
MLSPVLLITATEIATILGVSRRHADRIIRTDDTFPEPLATFVNGLRVWASEDVERWKRKNRS